MREFSYEAATIRQSRNDFCRFWHDVQTFPCGVSTFSQRGQIWRSGTSIVEKHFSQSHVSWVSQPRQEMGKRVSRI